MHRRDLSLWGGLCLLLVPACATRPPLALAPEELAAVDAPPAPAAPAAPAALPVSPSFPPRFSAPQAEERLRDPEGWFVELSPALWATGLSANLDPDGAQHLRADLDMLEDTNGGLFASLDAKRTDWGYWFSGWYVQMQGDAQTTTGPADIDFENAAAEFGITVLWEYPNLDFFLGGRWQYLSLDATVPGMPRQSVDTNWVEPVVGARYRFDVTDTLRFQLHGDIGGFGLGSHLTWSLYTALQLRPWEHVSLDLAYKAVDTTIDRAAYDYDGRVEGVMLGTTFYW